MSQDKYDLYGGTLTDLREVNNRPKLMCSYLYGLQYPITDHIQLQAELNLVSVEKAWMFWHQCISGALQEITVLPFLSAGEYFLRDDNAVGGVISYFLGMGVGVAWYFLEYRQHNWPFNDAKPLRYSRQSLGLCISF
jgi:hypothetical protein